MYKLLSKVLANRLRAVLDNLIFESQNSLLAEDRFWIQCLLQMNVWIAG